MPGSGSLVATLHLYNAAPKDGTTIGVVGGGVVLEPLLGNPQAKYDARRFNWIGGRTKDNIVCATWNKVPVRTMADVTKRETVVGATGPGSRTLTHPRAFNELLGTKFKIVSGYPGGNEITLAVERGEVEGYCGWTVGSIVNRASSWLHDGTLTLLAQFTRDLPNVPVARDLVPTETGKRAIDFLSADVVLAWPLVAPPDLPAERVKELRAAFLAMMKDPELRAEAAKLKLEIAAGARTRNAGAGRTALRLAARRDRTGQEDQQRAIGGAQEQGSRRWVCGADRTISSRSTTGGRSSSTARRSPTSPSIPLSARRRARWRGSTTSRRRRRTAS